jgi:hypothetical protein
VLLRPASAPFRARSHADGYISRSRRHARLSAGKSVTLGKLKVAFTAATLKIEPKL